MLSFTKAILFYLSLSFFSLRVTRSRCREAGERGCVLGEGAAGGLPRLAVPGVIVLRAATCSALHNRDISLSVKGIR